MDVFNKVLCKESIKLAPNQLCNTYKTTIFSKLKNKVEGICTKHGFIKHDSIEIYKITPGTIELISLAANIIYDVEFYAEVCNPLINNVIKGTVSQINRFGILAIAGYKIDNKEYNVLEIIIPKNSVNIKSDVNLDSLKINDPITIELIGKKIALNGVRISGIGRVIKDVKQVQKNKANLMYEQEDEENEDDKEIIVDDDENENEDEDEDADDENEDEEVEDEEVEASVKNGAESGFYSESDMFSDEDFDDEFNDDDKSDASESEPESD